MDGMYSTSCYVVGVPITYSPEDGDPVNVGAVFASCSFRSFSDYRANLMQMFLLAAVAAFMVSFCIVWLYSYSLVRPLRDMASAARSFGDGNFSRRVPITGDDEIGQLAIAFNNMASSLATSESVRRNFIANVSHELKTPLHSISGCAELMLSGIVKEEDKPRFLKQIYDEAQHMVSLIENIIKISRLDEEADALPVDKVDLYEIAQTVIEQLGNKAASRGIVMDLSGTHVTIKGVKTLLYEMIYNLCDNAIKYNVDDGAISVSVKKTKDAAVVKVKDTGVGISEDQQERIFERFYRVDKSHSRASGGTGWDFPSSSTPPSGTTRPSRSRASLAKERPSSCAFR